MKKKLSLPIVIAIALVVAAIAFSLGYVASNIAVNKKIKDLSEKQKLFTKLAAIDNSVRQNYKGEIDEENLTDELCRAYASSIGERLVYLNKSEYKDSEYYRAKLPNVYELKDKSAIVILDEGETYEPEAKFVLTVFLDTDSTDQRVREITEEIGALENVKKAEFISKADALATYGENLSEDALLRISEANPLPDAVRVILKDGELLDETLISIAEIDGVDAVG